MNKSLTLRRIGLLSLALVAACGLIDLDSFRGVRFQLPTKSFSVSTADPRWQAPPGGMVPDVACVNATDCCNIPAGAVGFGFDCSAFPLTCEPGGKCGYRFPYEVAQLVDLGKEVPQLKSGQVISEVNLKTIDLTTVNNLNVALPPVDLFVAPANVTSGSNAAARLFAQLPEHAAGSTKREVITLTAAQQAAFSQFARDFQTPFNIIARTTVLLTGGQAAPAGKADFTITGQVEARF